MNRTHASAICEYVEAWTALQHRPAEWLLSVEGDAAHERYAQALLAFYTELDEDEAA